MNVNLIGGGFQHDYSSTANKKSKYITYDKQVIINPITFYVDTGIYKGMSANNDIEKYKIAWINESKEFFDYQQFINNPKLLDTFDLVLTYDDRLISISDKFQFLNPIGYWIKEAKLYPKTKLISMISSSKSVCDGHKYRLSIIEKYKDFVDIYGRGIRDIEFKEEGLCDYAFSITMENAVIDTYFTEKILDCFATGTIPIYHGTKNITKFFNKDGIIFLDEFNINELNMDLYYSKIDAIKENLEIVKNMETSEDQIYLKVLKNWI